MKTKIIIAGLIVLLFSVLLSACSKGGELVVTGIEESGQSIFDISDDYYSKMTNHRGVFGAWEVVVDTETLTAEMIPARNAHAVGDVFDADLQQFLTVSPCANCLTISRIYMPATYTIAVEFRMRHPFPNITTRPDLHGFDTRLIFISETSGMQFPDIHVVLPDGSEVESELSSRLLVNYDGFTSHHDEIVTDERYFVGGEDIPGNLNPFIRFFEDYSTDPFDPHAPAGHNVIPVGGTFDTQTAYFYGEGMSNLMFYAVADVAYGHSATYLMRDNPQYYLPWFNRTEAWRTEYYIENNTLSDTDPASTADVIVQVFDWQHNATVDSSFPDPANLSGVPESSRVAIVEMSAPELQNSLIQVTVPEGGDGSPNNPLEYRLTVTNENGADSSQYALIAVRDELYGQPYPSGRMPIPDLPAGFPYETTDIRDYAIYNIVVIPVPFSSRDREYNDELSVEPRHTYTNSGSVQIYPRFFKEEAGYNNTYEWDYDYDGVTFDVDYTGYPSERFDVANTGRNNVGLRVTTTTVPPTVHTYNIPVYYKGVNFDVSLDTGTPNSDTTYLSRSHAVGITDANYYIAFTHHHSGSYYIYLAIGDHDGEFSIVNVTPFATSPCFNPAIALVENGPNAGVYVSFTASNAGDFDLFSMYGNLDGTGFSDTHLSPISATVGENESNAVLYATDTTLYAYYMHNFPATAGDICVSSRDFGVDAWTYHGIVNTVTTGDQNYPTIGFSEPYSFLYCAWHDSRNYADRGYDIYINYSTDFINFSEEKLVSSSPGFIHDLYPSMAVHDNQIGIAYMALNAASSTALTHVAITDLYQSTIIDHQPISFSNLHTVPALSSACDGFMTLGYGEWASSIERLTTRIAEVYSYESDWRVYSTIYITDPAGEPVAAGAANIFPSIATRKINDGYCIDNLLVYRSFADGTTNAADPPMSFGTLRVQNWIRPSDESGPY